MNGIAVSSLVLGIVGVLLIVLSFAMLRVSTLLFFGGLACCGLAVAFGASGVRRSPTRAGRGLAWAGLIVGAVMLVAVIALFAIAMLLFMSYMSE